MQKGHTRPLASLLLFCVLVAILLIISSVASTQSSRLRAAGPLLSLDRLQREPLPGPPRQVIGCMECPERDGGVDTQQGPDPDDDITANAVATEEFDPNSSPVTGANSIAFVSNGEDADGDRQIDPTLPDEPNFNIWLMRPDGTQQVQLVDLPGDQREPAFNPSGRLLAYASNQTGTYQIYTIEISTGVIWQITTPGGGAGNKRHPTWSPDSNSIAFQCDRSGNWDIYKIPSTGAGSEVPLAVSSNDETSPAWSPTSPYIAFQTTVGTVERILAMDGDGGNVTGLSTGGGYPDADDVDPAWQPTGQSIVFSSSRPTGPGDTTNDFNIWRMSAVGEAVGADATIATLDVLDDEYDDTNPTWSPDLDQRARMRFVFQSTRPDAAGSEPDIWATFVRDTMPPVLVNAPGREDALPWVDDRNPPPGSDITVSVAVYDKDSGVSSVVAMFKDPDVKVYLWWDGARFEQWMGTEAGCHQALEWDCVTIGSTQLFDDGVAPDSTAGDGVFTGTYTTTSVPRDYIIDVATTDNMGNSLTYDDIYGFSTVTFNPDDRVLFVDDYCEGQMFIWMTGYNTDYPAAFPNESYWRYNPGYAEGLEWSTDFDSIAGPFNESYDVWRIICRGAIPATILRNYLPSSDYQLDPADALASPTTAKATREVPVANRMVFWAAPHTGDVWICDGTMLDAATQAQMSQFLDQGGRLFISGQDLAWALTMEDKTTNNFLTNYLRASYFTDAAGTWGFTVEGVDTDPVSWDAWVESSSVHYHAPPMFAPNWWEPADNPIDLVTPQNQTATQPCLCDAAEFSDWADGITPVGDVKMYGYGDFDGTGAGTRYQNFTTGARVAFLSFGFEQIHRRYINAHDPIPAHCANHRSHLAHNAKCWMRTATFQGRVVSISEGAKPVTDPEPVVIATLLAGVREEPDDGDGLVGEVTEYKYAVRCQKDGTYIMQGLNPGHYIFDVIRTGFEIDHGTWAWVHGGQEPVQVDFAIKEAQPGAIAGIVTSEATGDFISNVIIRVYPAPVEEEEEEDEEAIESVTAAQADGDIPIDELGDPIGEGISAADGTFVIPGIPPGDYIVVADGTDVGYGTQQLLVTVTPGNTTHVVFILGAADGVLQVHVTSADTGDDIDNATIAVLDENGQQVVVPAPVTDATGIANIAVAAGTYQVRASCAGYESSALQGVVVFSQEIAVLDIALNRVPDGGISGKVASATTGQPVGGVEIRVLSGGTVIRSTVTSGTLTDPGDGTPPYNYIFDDNDPDPDNRIPAGEVVVQPVVSGYKPQPQQRVVTVVSGETTTGVSFVLESLHVFPAGLQLMSLPWDFSDRDAAALLGVAPAEFRMATWETDGGRYRVYPNAPADRFRLGSGYWLNLANAADLAQEGTLATTIYETPLVPGWNLIGNPFLSSIDFYAASVREQDGVLRSVQDAMSRNVLGSGLFAYMLGGYRVVSALTPYVGYWLHANEPCRLFIDESTDTLAVAAQAARPAVPVPADGWLLQLQTTATVAGLQDTAAYIGTAAGASDGFDPGLDQAKPPVPISGGYVYLSLQGANALNMAVDIRSQQSRQQQWDIEVQTNLNGQPIEVSWPDMSSLPRGTQPILTDLASGKRVYMRTNRAYTFEADGHSRRLQVSTSAAGVGQLAITAAVASTRAASAAVSYTLSKNAQVTIDVHNISGRLISRVVQDQSQAAGLQSVAWNGRNQAGLRVPNGCYLIRISAHTEDGQQVQALAQVAITR